MAEARVLESSEVTAVAKAWAHVRANLRRSAGQRLFDQWLKPVELIDSSDTDAIRLGLPSAFLTQWVRNHYAERLLLEFKAVLPSVTSVSIDTVEDKPARVLTADAPAIPLTTPAERPSFDPRFTFDRFVTDSTNKVAFNAALALAGSGNPIFSPLYLHSGTGQGKTHLMNAIGAAYRARVPGATILFMSAEKFMVDFVSAMRDRDTLSFKSRLRSADLLMIDDIQFIAGKGSTQEEFLHTLNELTTAGRPDRPSAPTDSGLKLRKSFSTNTRITRSGSNCRPLVRSSSISARVQ